MRDTPAFHVRPLGPGDSSAWLRLRQALWPDSDAAELAAEMAEIAAQPGRTPVFGAVTEDGALCGMVEVSIRRQAEGCSTDRIGYLEGWYVVPAWRRRGVGRALVAAAEAWASAMGCTEMASDTTPDYPLSPAAHAALGYREVGRTIHFHRRLAS